MSVAAPGPGGFRESSRRRSEVPLGQGVNPCWLFHTAFFVRTFLIRHRGRNIMFGRQICWKLFFCLSILTGMAAAQVTTGSIIGTVKDSGGAVLPGVGIKLTNTETGITRMVTADEFGRYNAPQLPLGGYEITAELPGFQKAVRRGVTLTIGREAVVDFTLQVGSVAQEVTVNAEAALVSTTNANLSYLIDDKKIRDLPLNGRNYTQLALM